MASPILSLRLVDRIVRPRAVRFKAASPPGHLLHLVEAGHVVQRAEGRVEVLRAGDLVWYHEGEPVEGRIVRAPWRFITVNFMAPGLAPPPDDARVVRASTGAASRLRRLLAVWQDGGLSRLRRELMAYRLLMDVVLEFLPEGTVRSSSDSGPVALSDRWWKVEKVLRQRLDEPVRLAEVARLTGLSERSAVRACRAATGLPPARRLKHIRLAQARNLLQLTDLTVTEIALAVGYERVQEFSRDMRKYTGHSPREVRRLVPDYRHLMQDDALAKRGRRTR